MQTGQAGKGLTRNLVQPPPTGKRFSVPHNTTKAHTANGILRDAGLPKAF
jgi:hypothetical protein